MVVVGERVDDRARRHARPSPRALLCSKVRHTTAADCGPRTRATSATDSRSPTPARRPSTTIGKPPSPVTAPTNDTWVRRVGLSNRIETVRGPSRQRSAKGAALRASARSSTARCSAAVRSSSARKWRRVIGRPRRWRGVAASSSPGRASTNRSSSAVVTTSGGARRIASGATGLTMKPASRARAATAARVVAGQGDRAAAGRRRGCR